MRRSILLCLLLSVLASLPAHATAVSPPGVNLRWDNCYGDGGAQYKNFACDTNSGFEEAVGSFELASAMSGVTGILVFLDLKSASSTLPAWWQYVNAGSCRMTALSAVYTPPAASVACTDWTDGGAVGGIAAYQLNTQGPNHARVLMATAVALPPH